MGQSSSRASGAPGSRHGRSASQQLSQSGRQGTGSSSSSGQQGGHGHGTTQQEAAAAAAAAEKEREARLYANVLVDYGALAPVNALYDAAAADWDPRVIRRLILERKLSPFYKGLADPDDGESTTTTTIARPKTSESPLPPASASPPPPTAIQIAMGQNGPGFGDGGPVVSLGRSTSVPIAAAPGPGRPRHAHTSSTGSLQSDQDIRPRTVSANAGSSSRAAAAMQPQGDPLLSHANLTPWISKEDLYRNPIECPICFLYYPRNINWSRCCDQPICTECFVQIQRPESGDPAACPFCVESHFGIIYFPPNTPAYLEKSGRTDFDDVPTESSSSGLLPPPIAAEFYSQSMPADISPISRLGESIDVGSPPPSSSLTKREGKKRRESMGHKAPGVVTVDDLRPDWFKKHQQLLLARAIQTQQRRYASLLAAGRPPPPPVVPSANAEEGEPDLVGAATAAAALVESMNQAGASAGRRSRGSSSGARPPRASRGGNQPLRDQVAIAGYFDAMRHMGADLEELMMMEAVRRSLQDLSTSDDQPEQQPGPADPADPPAESAAGPSEDTSPAADTPHSDTDGTAGSSDSEGNGHDATQNGRTVAKTAVVPGLRVNFADDDPSSPVVEAFMDNADETGA